MKIRRIVCMLTMLMLLASVQAGALAKGKAKTYLNLEGQRLKYNDVKNMLASYSGLKKVDMFNVPVDRKQAEELETLYPDVEFGWTLKIGRDHLVRTDATAFSTLHWSSSPTHTAEEMKVLRYCKRLRALDFGHNGVDDISWLAELTDLRILIIAVNRVADISPLASLKKLEYLELFNNRITDLTPLKGLTHLMDLNISYNSIGDYSPLYEMTWLKRLWIANSSTNRKKVPEETVETLKKKLPACQIDWLSKPTLGGWREHPHHDVISRIFDRKKGMEYIPFTDSWPDYPDDEKDEGL